MSPRVVLVALAILLALVSTSLLERRRNLRDEVDGLTRTRAATAVATGDARLAAEVDRIRLALERARNAPERTAPTHLALSISDGLLSLERGDVVLRSATVAPDVPRGVRVIERVDATAIVLAGGIQLRPATARDDTAKPPAGTVRLTRADFEAIRPNVRPGLSAFFF